MARGIRRTHRVVIFNDGSYGVEVAIPGHDPWTVSGFRSEEDARAWVEAQRRKLAPGRQG